MLRYRIFCLGCLSLVASGLTCAAEHEGLPAALVIVTADQHSAYDRTAQFVGLVDRLKTEHPGLPLAILIDGDAFEYGNVVARRSSGEIDFAMFAALAQRAPTVVNLGNHEPEFFEVAETVKRLEAAGVTVVSNLGNRASGQPFASASTKIKLSRDEAVIVGLTTDHLATYRVAVRPSLDLANPAVWAKQNLPALLASAPLRIVLSHAGLVADQAIQPLLPDGTLFAGAHDHLRFVEPQGRGVYFHSGSWNDYVSLAWLSYDTAGTPSWRVEQRPVLIEGPPDAALAALIQSVKQKYLTPDDTATVGHLSAARGPADAARLLVRALRISTGVDAAFIGNTTFGAGLPSGAISRIDFDACVRFDGTIQTAEVDGVRLKALLAAANQGPDTPLAERRGEFCFADGPATIEPERRYRIATTDWGARNSQAYFGSPEIPWQELPGPKLKVRLLGALGNP
jgi:5'-nucleotidase / UDP-sugar diphosphatase